MEAERVWFKSGADMAGMAKEWPKLEEKGLDTWWRRQIDKGMRTEQSVKRDTARPLIQFTDDYIYHSEFILHNNVCL